MGVIVMRFSAFHPHPNPPPSEGEGKFYIPLSASHQEEDKHEGTRIFLCRQESIAVMGLYETDYQPVWKIPPRAKPCVPRELDDKIASTISAYTFPAG